MAVEISDNPMLLLIAGVFVITFVMVCVLAYAVLSKGRRGAEPRTWQLQFSSRLPVSKHTFDRVTDGVERVVAPPQVSPSTRATLDELQRVRRGLASAYRIAFIAVGLAGTVAGIMLLWSHTPANMQGLPGAIILLLALGALLKGLVPGPVVDPAEPLAPDLLRQMRERISVQVKTLEPLEVKLGSSEIQQLSDMVARGAPIAEAIRAVYPAYDTLSDLDKKWLESTLSKYVQEQKSNPPG